MSAPTAPAFGCRLFSAIVVVGYVLTLAWYACVHSPTFNEVGHLPAGLSHWQFGRFELYRVNPPLPRMVAALPVLFLNPQTDWSNYSLSPFGEETIPMGVRFTHSNGRRVLWLYSVGRLACIPFCVLGALTCCWWASELWGRYAGCAAMALWCVNPLLLGHGPLVMPDVPAAAVGVFAAYRFNRWLRETSWARALQAGVSLGLALLCKTTLLILPPVWGLLWLVSRVFRKKEFRLLGLRRELLQLLVGGLAALYVINVGYGFCDTLQRVSDFEFRSRWLSGGWQQENPTVGNRFSGTLVGDIPVPIPAAYVQGIDQQKMDFDVGERSYLRGEWRERGWWYYHLYALAIKTPLATELLLMFAAILTLASGTANTRWRDELVLLANAGAIMALVSSQTGFSNHVRYAIPVLPYLVIWMTKVFELISGIGVWKIWAATGLVAWSGVSSLSVIPHSISYFNELAGPPAKWHWHLIDSNLAWGQDHLFLKAWHDSHPEARPLRAALFGWIDPRIGGLKISLPPVGPSRPIVGGNPERLKELGPLPGWYAIDANYLHGTHYLAADGSGKWNRIAAIGDNYEYFMQFEPVAMIGFSTFIYHITEGESNVVRRKLGLPPVCLQEEGVTWQPRLQPVFGRD